MLGHNIAGPNRKPTQGKGSVVSLLSGPVSFPLYKSFVGQGSHGHCSWVGSPTFLGWLMSSWAESHFVNWCSFCTSKG